MADVEIRQLRSQLDHFQNLVRSVELDLAAYGVGDTADELRSALNRAEGVLNVLAENTPLSRELRRLFDVVKKTARHERHPESAAV
ncbi:MAG: hypothetical protein ACRDUS_10895 [Mycobacterium sp.]